MRQKYIVFLLLNLIAKYGQLDAIGFMQVDPFFEVDRHLRQFDDLYASRFATDIFEENGNIIVEMNIPGMKKEEIVIEVKDNNLLKISGSKKSSSKTQSAHFYQQEIKSGNFERSFRLPVKVDENHITASIKDGVLRVVLPMKVKNQPNVKKIIIKD